MKRLAAIVRLILDNADAARLGAVDAGVPDQDLPDIVQEALTFAWLRAARGAFVLSRDPREACRGVRAYLYTTGKHQGLYRMRNRWRLVPVAKIHESDLAIDPEPRIFARDELRALVRRARLRPDIDIAEHVEPTKPIDYGTLSHRRYRLRTGKHR